MQPPALFMDRSVVRCEHTRIATDAGRVVQFCFVERSKHFINEDIRVVA